MPLAQITGVTSPSNVFTNSIAPTLPEFFVSRFLIYAIAFAGLFFFVRITVSGYQYLTSAGDPGKVQAASKGLINSTLGIFIVVMSYFIAQIIFNILGIGGVA